MAVTEYRQKQRERHRINRGPTQPKGPRHPRAQHALVVRQQQRVRRRPRHVDARGRGQRDREQLQRHAAGRHRRRRAYHVADLVEHEGVALDGQAEAGDAAWWGLGGGVDGGVAGLSLGKRVESD